MTDDHLYFILFSYIIKIVTEKYNILNDKIRKEISPKIT